MNSSAAPLPPAVPPLKDADYRPRVKIEEVDFAFRIGGYRFFFCSAGVKSVGAIFYRQLLAVLDGDDREILYVAAESNPIEGGSVVHLGRFSAGEHATLGASEALGHQVFFVPVASRVAREALGLPYERFPLAEIEKAAIVAIPNLFARQFPGACRDGFTQRLIDELAAALELAMAGE